MSAGNASIGSPGILSRPGLVLGLNFLVLAKSPRPWHDSSTVARRP